MKIPLTQLYFSKEEERAVSNVIKSGWIMQGEKVEQFENELEAYIGIRHVVLVSSGTAALHIALLSLGIGSGDEVIIPSFSFVATANCVLYVGAKPIFADINPSTYTIDPHDIRQKITRKTKAIIVVHQVGLTADMDPIIEIAKSHKLVIIEDAACALGARYKGRMAGTFGQIACFSFHPRKSITTAEGGAVVTNNKNIALLARSLRNHGLMKDPSGDRAVNLGYNYRLTDIQAAIGLVQLTKIATILTKRRKLAGLYNDVFKSIPAVTIPFAPTDSYHTYQSYLLRLSKGKNIRSRIIACMAKKGIACKESISAIHTEPLYRKLFGKIHLPETEKAYDEGLILPLYPQMTKEEQGYVIDNLLKFLEE